MFPPSMLCNQPHASKGQGLAVAAASFNKVSKTDLTDMKKETEAAVSQGQLKALTLMLAQCAAPKIINPTFGMQYLL